MGKKILLALSLFVFLAFSSFAQAVSSRIVGQVIEEDSGLPVIQAGVQILSAKDSSQVEIAVTDLEGRFGIKLPAGDYIVKVTFAGFKPLFRDVHQTSSQSDYSLGVLQMAPDIKMLKASVVAAKVEPITIVEDTVVYNAAAYRVPEDAMLDELLKKIPGLEIDASGNVTLQGKQVKQILVNGKRYFGGDVKTGLKNLQANMVENIRAYERQSDFSRITGIEDGEEEPVLDLTIKKNMMEGWRGNINAAGGNEKRMNFRGNMNKITKQEQYTVIASMTNTVGKPSINTTSRSQLGNGGTGERLYSEGGLNFAKDWKKLELAGHLQYTGTDRETEYQGHTESLSSPTSTTYTNTNGSNSIENRAVKADVSLEWRPTPLWTIFIKPQFNFSTNSNIANPFANQFTADPYEYVENPNAVLGLDAPCEELKSISNYASKNRTAVFDKRLMFAMTAQATRRFASKKGRTITLRAYRVWRPDHSWSFYDYHTLYFKKKAPKNTTDRKQYVDYDPGSIQSQLQLSYSEPFAKRFSLQVTIMGDFRYSKYNKDSYTFLYQTYGNPKMNFFPDYSVLQSHSLDEQIANLPAAYTDALESAISPHGTYDYRALVTTVNVRYFKKKMNITAGFQARPQWTTMSYTNNGVFDSRDDYVFNIAPFVTFRYNRKKAHQMMFTYRSGVGTPGLYNLLPVQNGSTPTNIHVGNPLLKPSFTHRLNYSYNYSNLKKQNSLVLNLSGFYVENATVNKSIYEPDQETLDQYGLSDLGIEGKGLEGTGIKLAIPDNLSGNWNAKATVSFNQTFHDTHFSMSNHAAAEYNNTQSFLYNSKVKESELNVSGRFMAKDMLEFCYRNDWLEILLNGGGEYTSETNDLRPDLNQSPLSLTAGTTVTVFFPWDMRFSTDFSYLNQNGYAFSELNRSYYYWNAELSQPLFKKKATLKFDIYDILGQQINLTRSFSSSSRSVALYNGINRYFLIRFIYRFKL